MVTRRHLVFVEVLRVLDLKRTQLADGTRRAEIALWEGNGHIGQPDVSALVKLDQILSDLVSMDHDDLKRGKRVFIPEILDI